MDSKHICKSTSLAVMDMCSKIIESIENKQFSCGVFLDFAKAFETVNHDILLKKLNHYGIRGTPCPIAQLLMSLLPHGANTR